MSTDTKYGDRIPDDHWDEDDDSEEPDDAEPLLEVNRHTIDIDDNRPSVDYEYGLVWTFYVDDGQIVAVAKAHWLEGRTQADPAGWAAWEDIPLIIRRRALQELNAEDADEVVNFDRVAEVVR